MNFVYYFHDEKSTEQFECLLLKIQSKYRIVSTDELYSSLINKEPIKNTCCLTVDDGWKSTYDVIFPIIKKHRIPITIFVSPKSCKTGYNFWFYLLNYCNLEKVKNAVVESGLFESTIVQYPIDLILKELDIDTITSIVNSSIDTSKVSEIPRGFINTEELLEMKSSGLVTIGSHTLNHPILANETSERSYLEIKDSINELSELIKEPIKYFAYPNGLFELDFGEREISTIKEMGINMAFSVDSNVITKNPNLFSVPRVCSEKRLDLGPIGVKLPSLYNQKGKREKIKHLKKHF